MTSEQLERICWGVALPGFGQLLNGKYIKGLFFTVVEVIINLQSNLNEVILYSFLGQIGHAIQLANYDWLMFYPCFYIFSIWDAYKDAGGGTTKYAVLPCAFGAYFGTVGVMYSRVWLGPVWLGLGLFFVGMFIGNLLRKRMIRQNYRETNHLQ
ncbi:hypothetical protein [Marinicrinis lubricantis]|uniref:Uncharacterized protein n=1 Tax=Marinicrinis lubricantis TaxID=2086470 RepID=A0ABW1IJ79_9BACL